jgi:glutathione S-transferase
MSSLETPMKLYQANLSMFAAPVRIQAYAKGIALEFLDPPGGLQSPEYLAINPTGKVPCLVDGDFVLPESETILEYIEDKHPEPSLRPKDIQTRARQRLLNRLTDLYVYQPMSRLFPQLSYKGRDQAVVDAALADLEKGLKRVEAFLEGPKYAVGGRLSLADCAIPPQLFFPVSMLPRFGREDALAGTPKLKAYFAEISQEPHVAKVLGEMGAALAETMKKRA